MTEELNLGPSLAAKLRRMRLRLELPDQDTLTVKRVPANKRCFNKDRTNVLIKRSSEGMPCVVCVDEDLEYQGSDRGLAQAFAAAPRQQGWRVLYCSGALHGELPAALEYALGILGSEEDGGMQAAEPASPRGGLLGAWAENLTIAMGGGRPGTTLFRDEEVEQVAACTLSWQGRLPLVVGEAGTGKTNLLCGVARMLVHRGRDMLTVNMGALMAGTLFESEREALLRKLLEEARESGSVLALEQAEWAVIGTARSLVLLREALDQGTPLIATAAAEHERRFAVHPLASRLDVVRLKELCASDTRRVLETLRPSISVHHGIEIDAEVEHAAVERSLTMDGLLPGKAVKLLDAAASRASLTGSAKATLLDVYVAASRMQVEST